MDIRCHGDTGREIVLVTERKKNGEKKKIIIFSKWSIPIFLLSISPLSKHGHSGVVQKQES